MVYSPHVASLVADAPPLEDLDHFAAEFEELRAAEGERLARYQQYRDECEATRDTDLNLTQPSTFTDYGRVKVKDGERLRHRFTFPFAQALTVKHAYRIAGRLPDAVVDRREETPQERYRSDTMEKIWWSIVRASNGETNFADAAWDASQVGAAAFDLYYDVNLQTPVFRAIDPANCLVVRGLNDPHDFERAYRWWNVPVTTLAATYHGKEFRGTPVTVDGVTEMVATVVQVATKTKLIKFIADAGGPQVVGLEEKEHNFGFVPYVIIPNLGPYRRIWGWADYEFVREIGRYINVALGREADVLGMTANGAVKATGTQMTAHQILQALQQGGVIPLKKDGDIAPVGAPEMPGFEQAHVTALFDVFERIGFAPPAAWGSLGASSGSDRGLQLQPMIELTAMKQSNYKAGLSRLGEMAFLMVERKQAGAARFYGTATRGVKSKKFNVTLDSTVTDPINQPIQTPDGEDVIQVPANPKDLFNGDHSIRFVWQNRIDVDDPAYVAAELNKFAQGVQSLRTTLERLGVEAPEDEIRLIETEAEQHPWLRQGMIKLLEMQLAADQQGQGGGQPFDPTAAIGSGLDTMTGSGTASLDSDALTGALNGGVGQLFGGA